jgi:L-alanine-DL-glutamate epimerase-like enolase superfamily enzyme
MKISAVRCFQVSGPADVQPMEERQSQMLDIYPEFARRGPSTQVGTRLTSTYVEVATDDGASGIFGPIFEETGVIILRKLAPYLVGQDPLAYERIWDVLYRQDRHARKGYEMMAISAVDNAIWDLRGKIFNLPIYRLLGGPTRSRIECYASMLGNSHDPGLIRERAQRAVEDGFKAEKWFFRYGPSDGLEGMEKNVAMLRIVREAVGPNVEIMVDAFMGWDATYAIRMLERIAEYRPRWMEEPVPPDRIDDFVAIKRSTNIPIATGEHEYTRWGFLQLLKAGAVDVIQADPDWCGGITELTKICALASSFGKQVVPHGHSIHAAVHVIASQPPATMPFAETLLLHLHSKQHFHTDVMFPKNGAIELPAAPGLGYAIDPAKVDRRTELS